MPLISLWKSDPATVYSFTIKQVVSFAGDGKLVDGSDCSSEFREYLTGTTSEKLQSYVEYCLSDSFEKSGLVLQDLVNELGRRLDFLVTDGLYSGRRNQIGNDGLWAAPEGGHIVLEVKTTDAYRMSMDTLAGYRTALIKNGKIDEESSILIVVGREDTGELEAQVRGSRHAWDIRLISADSLAKMVLLKENSDETETGQKLRNLLRPVEYTRVDALVDVVFATATDVDQEIVDNSDEEASNLGEQKRTYDVTDRNSLSAKRDQVVAAIGKHFGSTLLKKSRATFWNSDKDSRIACTISKRYEVGNTYWYAFHTKWREFLSSAREASLVLGCMDKELAFAIPLHDLEPVLEYLDTSGKNDKLYWHIRLAELPDGNMQLIVPRRESIPLNEYSVPLGS